MKPYKYSEWGTAMSEIGNDLPIYVATDEFLAELRELGYTDSIELDDLMDLLEEDGMSIEHLKPTNYKLLEPLVQHKHSLSTPRN